MKSIKPFLCLKKGVKENPIYILKIQKKILEEVDMVSGNDNMIPI